MRRTRTNKSKTNGKDNRLITKTGGCVILTHPLSGAEGLYKFPGTALQVPCRAGQNFFSGSEIYFQAFEIYFSATEIYFKATEIVLYPAVRNLLPLRGE
jgi:hypothetical protein